MGSVVECSAARKVFGICVLRLCPRVCRWHPSGVAASSELELCVVWFVQFTSIVTVQSSFRCMDGRKLQNAKQFCHCLTRCKNRKHVYTWITFHTRDFRKIGVKNQWWLNFLQWLLITVVPQIGISSRHPFGCGVPRGVQPPPPPEIQNFDKAEPNSQFRGGYIRNNLIRIRVSLIWKLSGTPD
jgi:hypothetical protein